jgi:chemotaxis protein CheZ
MMPAARRPALRERYGADLARLVAAVEADSDAAFLEALDELVSLRRRELFGRLRRLTSRLQSALERFNIDSRIARLAEREVPDARARLAHVLELTDQAAHRTMDLVDQSVPLAARAGDGATALSHALSEWVSAGGPRAPLPDLVERISAYLVATRTETAKLKNNLNEVVMTQTFQDLTGQIIRSVITLVLELESTLAELMSIASADGAGSADDAASPNAGIAPGTADARGSADREVGKGAYGPVVPGVTRGPVVAAQAEVDDLLSGLGL